MRGQGKGEREGKDMVRGGDRKGKKEVGKRQEEVEKERTG